MTSFILGLIIGSLVTLYLARAELRSSVNRAVGNGIKSLRNQKKAKGKNTRAKNRNTEGYE